MQNFSSLALVVQKLRGVCSQSTPPPGMGCDESPPGIGLRMLLKSLNVLMRLSEHGHKEEDSKFRADIYFVGL